MMGRSLPAGAYDYTRPPRRGHNAPVKRVTLGTGQTMVLADYRQRFRARIADSLLIGVGFVIAAILWFVILVGQAFDAWGSTGQQSEGPTTADGLWACGVFIPLLVYEIVVVAQLGKTLGMRAVDIRVVSIKSGQRPSAFESFWRGALSVCLYPLLYPLLFVINQNSGSKFALFGLLAAPCWWLLVQASVFWGKDRRGWHDLISGTVVVTAEPPVPADPRIGQRAAGRTATGNSGD